MDKLKEVKKIIQMMNEGSVTTQDLQTFITATLEFVKKQKDDFLQISQDSIDEVDKIVLYIEKEHEKTLQKVDEKSSKLEQELTKQIKEVKYLLEGAKNLIPQDGRDGLNGKDGKDGSPDTPEEIVKKINTTENSIDAKVIKDSATYVRKNDLDYAVSVLENQTRFLIASNSNRGSSTGGLTSLNALTGAVTLSAGTNMSLNQVGQDIEFNANFTQMGKYMISGGATWSGTGLTYDVSFLTYFFNGNKTANPTSVTLAASDPTNNRFDSIVVDEAGVVTVITGTPSSSPEVPPIPEDQLGVTVILVEAGSTTPTVATEEIYMDDPTTNWTFSTYTTGTPTGSINFAGTNTPKQGTECIEASTDARLGARFVRGTSFDAFQYTMLQVWVRFTGTAVATNKSLNVRFENSAGTLVGSTVNLFSYGLQRGVLNTWQLVVVPITAFGALPATVKGLKVIMAGGTVGVVRQWDVDFMILTNGSVPYANVPTIAFYKDDIGIASQSGINLIEGTGVTIDAVNNPLYNRVDYTINSAGGSPAGSDTQIQYNNAGAFGASSDFTRSDTIYNSVIRSVEEPKNPTFTGSGLDDLSFSGTFIGENTTTYTVTVASTGTPDTFDWTDGPNSGTGLNCSPNTLLSNGISIQFTNNIGHTTGDSWTFTFGVSKSVIKQEVRESEIYSLTEDGKLFGLRTNEDGTIIVGHFDSGSAIKLLIDATAKTAVLGNVSGGNNTKITIDDLNEQITISNLPAYDDDTAAGVGGLTAGMVYMTTGSGSAPLNAAGILMIKQ